MEQPDLHEQLTWREDAIRDLLPDAYYSVYALDSSLNDGAVIRDHHGPSANTFSSQSNLLTGGDLNPLHVPLQPDPAPCGTSQSYNSLFVTPSEIFTLTTSFAQPSTELWTETEPCPNTTALAVNSNGFVPMSNTAPMEFESNMLTINPLSTSLPALASEGNNNNKFFNDFSLTATMASDWTFNGDFTLLDNRNLSGTISNPMLADADFLNSADPSSFLLSTSGTRPTHLQQPFYFVNPTASADSVSKVGTQRLSMSLSGMDAPDWIGTHFLSEDPYNDKCQGHVTLLDNLPSAEPLDLMTGVSESAASHSHGEDLLDGSEAIPDIKTVPDIERKPEPEPDFQADSMSDSTLVKNRLPTTLTKVKAGQIVKNAKMKGIPSSRMITYALNDIEPQQQARAVVKLKEMRDLRACILCKLSKTKCAKQTPCNCPPCQRPFSKDTKLRMPRSWGFFDCVRERISDLIPFCDGPAAIPFSVMQPSFFVAFSLKHLISVPPLEFGCIFTYAHLYFHVIIGIGNGKFRERICKTTGNTKLDRLIFLIKCMGRHVISKWPSDFDQTREEVEKQIAWFGCNCNGGCVGETKPNTYTSGEAQDITEDQSGIR